MNINTIALFKNMSEEDITKTLSCSGAKEQYFKKNSYLFHTGDIPAYLYILTEGEVHVCKDTPNGNRLIMNTFSKPGTTFGEVYLFVDEKPYDFYVVTTKDTRVLCVPKHYFYQTCDRSCGHHQKVIKNMLSILSEKAYFLNKKIQIIAAGSLRHKLAEFFLQNCTDEGIVTSSMSREQLADYLGVTRPSLSRELMKMKEEGILEINRKQIKILDFDLLES
ncbi:MAG: Crp/Fnr family transcriptional regulator [bacterium]|nr:Crp/Fnr family transcriptional regulator [bacterium]